MRKLLMTAAAGCLLALVPDVAMAGEKKAKRQAPAVQDQGGEHPRSSYYRRAPQVRGFVQRRGGYSFTKSDVINTYGDSRTSGATNSYRDPNIDRQTSAGPFDHGFFFDSGIGMIGRPSNSPYPN